MQIIEQLNNLQLGDLVWWRDEGQEGMVIGIVTEVYDGYNPKQALWRAEFADGEHCFWGEFYHEYVEEGMMGAI